MARSSDGVDVGRERTGLPDGAEAARGGRSGAAAAGSPKDRIHSDRERGKLRARAMILASDLLQPIPGENPSGVSLRGSELYAQVEEARRKDDDLPKGVWKEGREAKRANFGKAAQLCVEA